MTGTFSKYLKSKQPAIRELVRLLGEKYAYASVLGTDVEGLTVAVDRSTTNVVPSPLTECGFVVKVFDGRGYVEYSTNVLDPKHLAAVVDAVDRLVAAKGTVPPVAVGALVETPLRKRFTRKNVGRDFTAEEIIATLKAYVDETIKSDPLVANARASVETVEISKIFISRDKDLAQYYTWSNPRSFVLARRGENAKYAYDGFGTNSVERALADLKASMASTAKLAIELLDSEPPKPGVYEIVTDPSITGLIAHEAFGHGVEMDMFVKDRAAAKDYMGKKVASRLVSMRDGAASAFSVASYFFDDDGVLAGDTRIIDKGILVDGISDVLSALQLGTVPTGNSRRESYKRKAYTRMTNTFFEKGRSSLSEMIASIKDGYYIVQTNNGMEDPKNWGIQCTAHYGREIKDGKFTGKIVSPVVMSGYVIDLLESITAVSNDFDVIGSGSCGKGYKEFVRVSDGGPCLKATVKIG
ncbi:MAG: TldD/PmbA family protein [Candidatus Izemoplasmatales bacterium]